MELNRKKASIPKLTLVFRPFLALSFIRYYLLSFYLFSHLAPYLFKRKEKRQTSKIICFILRLFFFNYSIQGFDYPNKSVIKLIHFNLILRFKRVFSLEITYLEALKMSKKLRCYWSKIKDESLIILVVLTAEKTKKI